MACAEVEEDELVDVACPSGPTADARSDPDYIGNYLTAIYPGPGYWLNNVARCGTPRNTRRRPAADARRDDSATR